MKYVNTLLAIIILILGSGCSLFMAYKQPDKKDLNVLNKGTPRALVIAELGQPAFTETKDNVRKAGRVAFHGAADLLTMGLWEVLGTPVEMAADGTEVKVQVAYDARDCVDYIQVLKGDDQFKGINSKR
jgi:hypothetical protein